MEWIIEPHPAKLEAEFTDAGGVGREMPSVLESASIRAVSPMENAVTIQDFMPWATIAAITIGIVWIVIQNVSSKLSTQIEAVGKVGEANIVRMEAAIQAGAKEQESSIARMEAVVQAGAKEQEANIVRMETSIQAGAKEQESNIARIEAAIQAGAKEHEQFRSDIKDTNRRLDNLYSLMLDRLPAKSG